LVFWDDGIVMNKKERWGMQIEIIWRIQVDMRN
jgi:hypothetical protein